MLSLSIRALFLRRLDKGADWRRPQPENHHEDMLHMNVPGGPYRMPGWSPADIKAMVAFMHRLTPS